MYFLGDILHWNIFVSAVLGSIDTKNNTGWNLVAALLLIKNTKLDISLHDFFLIQEVFITFALAELSRR